jgi:hypothetical protein
VQRTSGTHCVTVWMRFAQGFVQVLYVVNPFKLSECADGLQFTHHTKALNLSVVLKYKQSTFTVAPDDFVLIYC